MEILFRTKETAFGKPCLFPKPHFLLLRRSTSVYFWRSQLAFVPGHPSTLLAGVADGFVRREQSSQGALRFLCADRFRLPDQSAVNTRYGSYPRLFYIFAKFVMHTRLGFCCCSWIANQAVQNVLFWYSYFAKFPVILSICRVQSMSYCRHVSKIPIFLSRLCTDQHVCFILAKSTH